MADPDAIVSRWEYLKQRHRWRLVDDEESFLIEVAGVCAAGRPQAVIISRAIDLAIYQRYNLRLYAALTAGLRHLDHDRTVDAFNQAYEEIRQFAWRLVCARGFSAEVADEVSQKISLRIVTHLDDLQKPGSLTAWLVWWVRAYLKEAVEAKAESSLTDSAEVRGPEILSAVDERVDREAREKELSGLLRRALSGFQHEVIVEIVLRQAAPAEFAAKRGVRVSKVYVEKSRALEKIKHHAGLRRFLGLPDQTADE